MDEAAGRRRAPSAPQATNHSCSRRTTQHSLRSIGLAKTPPQPPPQPPPQSQPNPVQTHRPRPPKPVEKQQKDRLTLAATPTPGVVQAPQQQRQRPLGRPQPCFQCPYQEQKAKSSSSEPPSPMLMPQTFAQTSQHQATPFVRVDAPLGSAPVRVKHRALLVV